MKFDMDNYVGNMAHHTEIQNKTDPVTTSHTVTEMLTLQKVLCDILARMPRLTVILSNH